MTSIQIEGLHKKLKRALSKSQQINLTGKANGKKSKRLFPINGAPTLIESNITIKTE